ncbi:penicillin-binding protein 1B [Reinekea marina]|uniref:Penicillin-binding protein 1B n=1 Tax=Reinekea marina TaxID=1310421 RepID=A0ABV7WSM8_9GAMM|nr:penicillin-binding protein 1B [Reinekea marina]MDN3650372.1 penicillin-binding protein 1B [Reinekea marina]
MAKKIPQKPKKTSSKPKKKSNQRRHLWHSFVSISLKIGIVAACLVFFWMIYLNAVVKERFEGRRFQIPARVYSEAQEIYAGAPVRQSEFIQLLNQLGYRSSASVSQEGRYVEHGNQVRVHTRGFRFWDGEESGRWLNIQFDANGIAQVTDSAGQSVLLSRLDPLYMGQVYPGVAEDRVLYRLEEMPETLVLGLLLVEDDRFFEHHGVSIRGIARALIANIISGRVSQGGSTLTQQLVKNLYLTSEKKISRKINEALMSLILEFHFSKNEILETYMNEVYVAQQGSRSIHGFGLAAQFFFATTLQDLDIHQQALLIGLIKGPSYYNPRRNPERATKRRNTVLEVWLDSGLINDAQYQAALKAPLDVADKPGQASFPAFMDGLRRQLQKDYRKDDLMAEGLSIFTTLSPVAQTTIEQQVAVGLADIERDHRLEPKFLQSAAVMTRPSTGDVLAVVGDRDARASGFNRALDAQRSIGSLMKPAVYLAAIEHGYNLSDLISDADVTVGAGDGTTWQPKNYDKTSHGNPMLIDAMANSYNQATARLGMEVGLANVFDVIDRLGIGNQVAKVPAVMLGAHGMSPMQVAQMYQTIAGNGFYTPLNFIRAVSHPEQGLIQRFDLSVKKQFEPEHIHILQRAMHEVTVTGTARSLQWRLPKNWWIAGKTGTTDDNRDAWFAGLTGDRQLVIWVGNDDNKPTPLTGSSGALPIWAKVMQVLRPIQERRTLPANIVEIDVNKAGRQVPSWCDDVRTIPFIAGNEPARGLTCHSNEPKPDTDDSTWLQKLFGRP